MGHEHYLKGKKAEEFVYELAKKSFLEDWCYPNPKFPDGKELCDLLVVYGDVAILWQIKDLKLNKNGRYDESKVKKNLRQCLGAKRRLFELKKSIELENPRRGKESFDPGLIRETHLISTLLGEGEDYFSFADVIKGSTIHTFTSEFTEIALGELDTIKDFVDYLKEKNDLLSANKQMTLFGGEKNLLAYYLMNERSFKKLKEPSFVLVTDDWWEGLQKKPEYLRKKEANKISYGWDGIIDRAHSAGGDYEKVARELARPDRLQRRVLSKDFFEAHMIAHNQTKGNTFRRCISLGGTTYCFVFLDDPEPRDNRKALLGAVCFVARGTHKDNKKVIGIATEMKLRSRCSYDFCVLELPQWTEQDQKNMEKLQKEMGIFKNPKMRHRHDEEYPREN